MPNLLTRERELYTAAWAMPAYAAFSPGEHYLPLFLDMTQTTMRQSVLDAGCGSGKGARALQAAGFERVTLCDFTAAGLVLEAQGFPFREVCLWHDVKKVVGFHDWVYCCDVLEHIPPQFTMLVIRRLLDVARRGVFLTVSTMPDAFGPWVGESLHKTVQPYTWWREQLQAMGTVQESRDLLNAGVFLVRP